MAIQNNTFFRVTGSVADETGASQISVADGVNIIGGGSVDEQQILLENSNHVYSTINRRALLDVWSPGVIGDSTTQYLYKEATAPTVTFDIALESPALVGVDRFSVTWVARYQGQIKVDIRRTDTGASLSAYTGGAEIAPITETQTQTWSGVQDVFIRVSMAPVPVSTDAILWGFRALEDQTSI